MRVHLAQHLRGVGFERARRIVRSGVAIISDVSESARPMVLVPTSSPSTHADLCEDLREVAGVQSPFGCYVGPARRISAERRHLHHALDKPQWRASPPWRGIKCPRASWNSSRARLLAYSHLDEQLGEVNTTASSDGERGRDDAADAGGTASRGNAPAKILSKRPAAGARLLVVPKVVE